MTAQVHRVVASFGGAVLIASFIAGCGPSYFEVPIETPLKAKLDISGFQRVLVAGFVTGGSDDVDANLETVRLLRSQLRSKSDLRVVEADVLALSQIAADQPGAMPADTEPEPDAQGTDDDVDPDEEVQDQQINSEAEIEQYEHIFADIEYWKALGEEYQNPLIVTGSVLFTPHQRSGFITREQEVYDSFGRRRVTPVRTYTERRGFILRPKFVFIDGRTGTTLYSESFREEILYNAQQNTPALSSYFELMDRLLPSFLTTLSSQTIRGSRTLLR